MIKYIRRVSSGLIAGAVVAAAMTVTPASAANLEGCVLLPNTGNYVRYPGQIDCYTGKHVSVEANAGNNIGTSPQSRRAEPSRNEKLAHRAHTQHERAHRAFHDAYNYAKAAKAAARARDWSSWKTNTRAAIASTKAGVEHAKNAARLKSKIR